MREATLAALRAAARPASSVSARQPYTNAASHAFADRRTTCAPRPRRDARRACSGAAPQETRAPENRYHWANASSSPRMQFTVATYNIHKGFSHLTRRMVIHELRERLHVLGADILFLQEVQGVNRRHAGRIRDWPGKPQHEFIAETMWRQVAYGKNAVYRHGHHGNAVLSRFRIVAQSNFDISAHAFESRGLLHCELE